MGERAETGFGVWWVPLSILMLFLADGLRAWLFEILSQSMIAEKTDVLIELLDFGHELLQ
jgi:hypothetical protein